MFFSQSIGKNNYYLNFGLQLYLKKIRVIKKWILIKKIRFFKVIEENYGLTFQIILDAFFIGSIFLLFFKFFIRLFFFTNPFWYFNIMIFCFGIFLQVYFNPNPLFLIRETFVKILKIGLGKNYWYNYNTKEVWSHFQHNGIGVEMPEINIFDTSFFNKICQKIFIFFILVRLYIIKAPFLFLFFNFLFTLFLLFNQFLLLSSFFSFLILISRLSFFATDYNLKKVYNVTNIIELKESDEYIIPNWENAELLSLVIIRNFHDRKLVPNYDYNEIVIIYDLKLHVYKKYIQINKEFAKYSNENSSMFKFSYRKAYSNEINDNYFQLLKMKKKNTIFLCFLPFEFLFYKNKNRNNFFEIIFPYLIPKAKNHPQEYCLFDKFLIRRNETTIKDGDDRIGLSVMPSSDHDVYTGRGVTRTCAIKKLTETEQYNLNSLFNKKLEKNEIEQGLVLPNYKPNFYNIDIPNEFLTDDILKLVIKNLASKSSLVVPEQICCFFAFLDPTSCKEQSLKSLEVSINYLEVNIENRFWNPIQKDDFIEFHHLLTYAKLRLEHMPNNLFGTTINPIIEYKMEILQKMTTDIQNLDVPPLFVIKSVLSKYNTKQPINDLLSLNVSNLNHVPKRFGGENKSKITYKGVLESRELKCRETNCTNNSSDIVA